MNLQPGVVMLGRLLAYFRTDLSKWHEHRPKSAVQLEDGTTAQAHSVVMRRIVSGRTEYRMLSQDERFAAWDADQW